MSDFIHWLANDTRGFLLSFSMAFIVGYIIGLLHSMALDRRARIRRRR